MGRGRAGDSRTRHTPARGGRTQRVRCVPGRRGNARSDGEHRSRSARSTLAPPRPVFPHHKQHKRHTLFMYAELT